MLLALIPYVSSPVGAPSPPYLDFMLAVVAEVLHVPMGVGVLDTQQGQGLQSESGQQRGLVLGRYRLVHFPHRCLDWRLKTLYEFARTGSVTTESSVVSIDSCFTIVKTAIVSI